MNDLNKLTDWYFINEGFPKDAIPRDSFWYARIRLGYALDNLYEVIKVDIEKKMLKLGQWLLKL